MAKQQRWAIEVKRSSAPTVSRGFHTAAQDLKVTARFVVHAGPDSFPLTEGVRVTALADLQHALIALAPVR